MFIERQLVKRGFEERVNAQASKNAVERWKCHKALPDEHGIDVQQEVFESKGQKLNDDE